MRVGNSAKIELSMKKPIRTFLLSRSAKKACPRSWKAFDMEIIHPSKIRRKERDLPRQTEHRNVRVTCREENQGWATHLRFAREG